MHRMNSNRVSSSNTSTALNDDSIVNIGRKFVAAKTRNQQPASQPEQVETQPTVSKKAKVDSPRYIKIANIAEIPTSFERMGTGFYRQGHHLWSLEKGSDGLILVRKGDDDHVLAQDPEPTVRVASRNVVTDRNGVELKKGSKVKFPHRGKIATGTVVILQPGAITLDSGGQALDMPPDMTECCEDDAPKSGGEFEPDLEPSSQLEEHVEAETEAEMPSPSQAPLSSPASPSSLPSVGAGKKAQVTPAPADAPTAPAGPPSETQNTSPSQPGAQQPQPYQESKLMMDIDRNGGKVMLYSPANGQRWYIEKKQNGNYNIKQVRSTYEDFDPDSTPQDLMNFESNLGQYQIGSGGLGKAAEKEAAVRTWAEYWRGVGQRVAAGRKPPTPEQKEKRRQRRKLRDQSKVGLPKTFKAADGLGGDDLVTELKERVRIYEQMTDELKYVLSDEKMKTNDALLADELTRTLENTQEQLAKMDEEEMEEHEDMTNLETPPMDTGSEGNLPPHMSSKSVSMSDLIK